MGAVLRHDLEQWLGSLGVRPRVVAGLDDDSLSNVLGESGLGVFAVPAVMEAETRRRYRVGLVGRVETLRQRFYAVTVERRIRNPAVAAICEGARRGTFAGAGS